MPFCKKSRNVSVGLCPALEPDPCVVVSSASSPDALWLPNNDDKGEVL
jgi:hypothetical protein